MALRSIDLLVGHLGPFTVKKGRVRPGGARIVSTPTVGKCGRCTDCTCITAEPTSCGPNSVDIACETCADTTLALGMLHLELARFLAAKSARTRRRKPRRARRAGRKALA